MKSTITTANTALHERSRHWHAAIATAYFPLDLQFRSPESFSGDLSLWTLGQVSLSRLTSEALQYKRLPHHFRAERDEHFLVTVPARSEAFFSQCGKDVRCQPGGFILERSHEPYEFSHHEAADLWVMKVEAKALGGRVRQPDRFCSMQFNAAEGAGGLFADMLHLIPGRFDAMTLNFQDGKFVGWFLGNEKGAKDYSTASGIGIGTTRAKAKRVGRSIQRAPNPSSTGSRPLAHRIAARAGSRRITTRWSMPESGGSTSASTASIPSGSAISRGMAT